MLLNTRERERERIIHTKIEREKLTKTEQGNYSRVEFCSSEFLHFERQALFGIEW